MSISGLTADGRGLCKLLRGECMNHQFAYGTEPRVNELAQLVAKKSQKKTIKYGGRPYGVGLLMIGCGSDGPRLFETTPAGEFIEWRAHSIGRRAQAAKTYLDQHVALANSLFNML